MLDALLLWLGNHRAYVKKKNWNIIQKTQLLSITEKLSKQKKIRTNICTKCHEDYLFRLRSTGWVRLSRVYNVVDGLLKMLMDTMPHQHLLLSCCVDDDNHRHYMRRMNTDSSVWDLKFRELIVIAILCHDNGGASGVKWSAQTARF